MKVSRSRPSKHGILPLQSRLARSHSAYGDKCFMTESLILSIRLSQSAEQRPYTQCAVIRNQNRQVIVSGESKCSASR
jgi:hypothetical protein